MPAGAGRSRRLQLADEYSEQLVLTDIPAAMSRLWLGGYPDKTGSDSRTGELLKLWGLNLERRRPNFGTTFYPSIREFKDSIGRFYHEYLHELYYRRFIDIHGRLWTPATLIDGHYTDSHVGNLREFHPDKCSEWFELSNWATVLQGN